MKLVVNGEPRECDAGVTVAGLLDTLDVDLRQIAVERNLEIVPRSTYASQQLAEGDQIEIVEFIGGG